MTFLKPFLVTLLIAITLIAVESALEYALQLYEDNTLAQHRKAIALLQEAAEILELLQ